MRRGTARAFIRAGMVVMALALGACGGGGGGGGFAFPFPTGGGAGTQPAPGGSDGGGGGTGTAPVPKGTVTLDVQSGTGASTGSLTAVEIGRVSAVVKDAAGAPVRGAVVRFTETGGTLLNLPAAAGTALTDDGGRASAELRAALSTGLGATVITATTSVGGTSVSAQKTVTITAAPAASGLSPQQAVTTIVLLDVNPPDRLIASKGVAVDGRSDTATLRFRLMDRNNTPVKGALLNFSVDSADVTLNVSGGTSGDDGVVTTSVSAGTKAAAAVVKAALDGSSLAVQADALTVTADAGRLARVDAAAAVLNLNARASGSRSTVAVAMADANGNPLPDGVPVTFTADFLAVGGASRGNCVISGGRCSVDLVVQAPSPADERFIRVVASSRLGTGAVISKAAQFSYNDPMQLGLYAGPTTADGRSLSELTISAAQCNAAQAFVLYAGTPAAFPAPAGTTVAVRPPDANLATVLDSPSVIADMADVPRTRTRLDLRLTPTGRACQVGYVQVLEARFTTLAPDGFTYTVPINVRTVP